LRFCGLDRLLGALAFNGQQEPGGRDPDQRSRPDPTAEVAESRTFGTARSTGNTDACPGARPLSSERPRATKHHVRARRSPPSRGAPVSYLRRSACRWAIFAGVM
jgi:hypothetical protein